MMYVCSVVWNKSICNPQIPKLCNIDESSYAQLYQHYPQGVIILSTGERFNNLY
jgi:hypothetical protein